MIRYTPEQLDLQKKLEQANINPASFLATDYLNHYNEIVMLMEMIPDMPELIEDLYEWSPKTYEQHFCESGFEQRSLAIEAYQNAPATIKTAFDYVNRVLSSTVQSTIEGLKLVSASNRGLSGDAKMLVTRRISDIQKLLMDLNGIIHGKIPQIVEEKATEDDVQTQEEIDKLFS